jgi:hypothetical protein
MRLKAVTRTRIVAQYAWLYRLPVFSGIVAAYGFLSVILEISRQSDLVAAGIAVVVVVLEGWRLHRDKGSVFYTPRIADPYDDIIDPDSAIYRCIASARDVGLHFTQLSAMVNTTDITVSEGRYTADPNLESRQYALGFLSERARDAKTFNGLVVGLGTDLPEVGVQNPRVELLRCRYFDFIRTNVFASHDVYHAGDGRIFSGRDLFIHRGRLESISDSQLANVVGVSTLAFCSDGKLLLTAQTRKSLGSPGLLAPSGSGALEQRDLDGGGCLQDILVRGVVRELQEETRVKQSELGEAKTEIIGYGRWLSRGAMPEFSAVTVLLSESRAVSSRPVSFIERPWVAGVIAVDLEPVHKWNGDKPAEMLPPHCRDSASFPLLLALASLADYIGSDKPMAMRVRTLLAEPSGESRRTPADASSTVSGEAH